MRNVRPSSSALAFVALLVLAACSSGSTSKDAHALANSNVPSNITVTSTDFVEGGAIPRANSCDGAGGAVHVAWRGVPATAKAVAVVVDDPDAPGGVFVHWVVVGLAPADASIPPLPSGAHELDNTGGSHGWTAPCPPAGQLHHYRFTVYALSDYVCAGNDEGNTEGCSPPAAADALQQIRQNAIAKGTLTATYHR